MVAQLLKYLLVSDPCVGLFRLPNGCNSNEIFEDLIRIIESDRAWLRAPMIFDFTDWTGLVVEQDFVGQLAYMRRRREEVGLPTDLVKISFLPTSIQTANSMGERFGFVRNCPIYVTSDLMDAWHHCAGDAPMPETARLFFRRSLLQRLMRWL